MQILDQNNNTPNILHFHGHNLDQLPKTFNAVLYKHQVNTNYDKDRMDIVSCWTDEERCVLLQQCKANNIELHNAVPDDYDRKQNWYMPNKIRFFIQYLEKCDKEIVVFLDGYDVLITQLNDILEKFYSFGYRIVFGPSCNNYPESNVDKVYQRCKKGTYRYFNAGCCMGYREDLLKFYKESLEYIDIPNPWNSEQYVMRHAWAKYSNNPNQNFITVDWNGTIFKSMGVTDSSVDANTIHFSINREPKKYYITIGCNVVFNEPIGVIIYDLQDDVQAACSFMKHLDIDCVLCDSNMSSPKKRLLQDSCDKYGVELRFK